MKLIFTDNAKGTHTHEETSTATAVVIPAGESISIPKQPGGPRKASSDVSVDVVILPEGHTIEFAKQPPLGGAGGNPWISLVFLNRDGEPVSGTFLLGRCVQDF